MDQFDEPAQGLKTARSLHARRIPLRRKILYALIVAVLFIASVELLLRLTRPPVVEFMRANLASHQSTSWARSDLVPNESTRIRRYDANNQLLVDFVLETDQYGMRRGRTDDDPQLAHQGAPRTIVHCIGDSYTLGWGVAGTDSYPSQLGQYLGPEYLVLNAGVDGFGLIEASTKSDLLAEHFPPQIIVYLFCSNDFENDAEAQARGEVAEDDRRIERFLRHGSQHVHLLNLPLALALWVQIQQRHEGDRPEQWSLPRPDELREMAAVEPAIDNATTRQLASLRRSCDEQDIHFLVVVLYDGQREALQMIRHCETTGQPHLIASMSSDTVLRGDGHLNVEGNRQLAHAVGDWVRALDETASDP